MPLAPHRRQMRKSGKFKEEGEEDLQRTHLILKNEITNRFVVDKKNNIQFIKIIKLDAQKSIFSF